MIAAYALPAIAAWMVLGLVLGALPVSTAALVLLSGYGAGYGLAAVAGPAAGRPLRAPGSRWQVPQSLVADAPRGRRLLIWGSLLGPGFATRNPYPGFALLPLAVAAAGGIAPAVTLAAAIGAAHGTGRGLALLRDTRELRAGTAAGHLAHLLKSLYWRRLDGVALLLTGGAAAAAWLHRL